MAACIRMLGVWGGAGWGSTEEQWVLPVLLSGKTRPSSPHPEAGQLSPQRVSLAPPPPTPARQLRASESDRGKSARRPLKRTPGPPAAFVRLSHNRRGFSPPEAVETAALERWGG